MQQSEKGWAKKRINKQDFPKSRDEGLHCLANDSHDDVEILTHATPCRCKKRLHEVNWTSSSDAPLRRSLKTSMLRSPREAQIFVSQWLTPSSRMHSTSSSNSRQNSSTDSLIYSKFHLMRGRFEVDGLYLFWDVKKYFHLFRREFDLFCK